MIARGEIFIEGESQLRSPLKEASDVQWKQFVTQMMVAKPEHVSLFNTLGMFAFTPKRLADFGYIDSLKRICLHGKTIWIGSFKPPLTSDEFLSNPGLQYEVFERSCRDYADKMSTGAIKKEPNMSTAGALAILHRAGPSGMKTWSTGKRFPDTIATYEKVAGIF